MESGAVLNTKKGALRWLDDNFEGIALMVGLLMMILLITYQTLGRYILVKWLGMTLSIAWTEEIARFIFVWISYLAIPISVKNRDMIRVDAFVGKLPKKWQDILWSASDFLFFTLSAAILYFGTKHVITLINFPQTTAVLRVSYGFVYMILPIGFGLITLRLIQDIIKQYHEHGLENVLSGFIIACLIIIPALSGIQASAGAWLFGYFFVLFMIGIPIAISLGLAALMTMLAADTLPLSYIATQAFTTIDNVAIMAIPFFIAAGTFMGEGGLSKRLLTMADDGLGRLSGGFGMATVLTCMMFAAMSGSGPATVAAVGSLAIPAMIERGYDKYFAAALVAAAGSIGVMIPPSNPFVVYGVTANASVGDLFMAGIVPGIVVGITLMLYTYFLAKKKGWRGEDKPHYFKRVLRSTWDAKWALMVPVIILGGIYSGIMTPTESAAVAAFYGLIVGVFLYKGIDKKNFKSCLVNSASTSSIVILLMAMAGIFGNILTMEKIPDMVANYILSLTDNKIVILIIINIMLLLVGMFMEALAAIVILVPILLPIAIQLGIDPVHFGVIMVVNLAIGFITPPVGVNLFVASGISKLKIEGISKSVLPMIGLMVIILLIITFIPEVVMWLPDLLNG